MLRNGLPSPSTRGVGREPRWTFDGRKGPLELSELMESLAFRLPKFSPDTDESGGPEAVDCVAGSVDRSLSFLTLKSGRGIGGSWMVGVVGWVAGAR